MAENVAQMVEPVFDPEHVGASLTRLQVQLPVHSDVMRGTVVGDVASRRRGYGYEKDGLRDYEFGDDPRHIDWAATARVPGGMPLVRERYADITPSLWIVTDMLDRRHQQNPGKFSEQILALSAITALMRIAYVNGMPTGVIGTDGQKVAIEQQAAGSGRTYMLRTAQQLARAIPTDMHNKKRGISLPERPAVYLGDMLSYAASRCTESMVAVVSDFRDVAEPDDDKHGWRRPLQQLAKGRNELLAVELTNPDDHELPEGVGRLTAYSGVKWVTKADRRNYAANAAQRDEAIAENLERVQAHHVQLSTTEPRWLTSMVRQLRSR